MLPSLASVTGGLSGAKDTTWSTSPRTGQCLENLVLVWSPSPPPPPAGMAITDAILEVTDPAGSTAPPLSLLLDGTNWEKS